LEAGLILVVLISIASVGPAAWAHSTDLMREHTIQLLFAALAVGLCIVERVYIRPNASVAIATATPAKANWYTIWR
jgi:hypothetical protein